MGRDGGVPWSVRVGSHGVFTFEARSARATPAGEADTAFLVDGSAARAETAVRRAAALAAASKSAASPLPSPPPSLPLSWREGGVPWGVRVGSRQGEVSIQWGERVGSLAWGGSAQSRCESPCW